MRHHRIHHPVHRRHKRRIHYPGRLIKSKQIVARNLDRGTRIRIGLKLPPAIILLPTSARLATYLLLISPLTFGVLAPRAPPAPPCPDPPDQRQNPSPALPAANPKPSAPAQNKRRDPHHRHRPRTHLAKSSLFGFRSIVHIVVLALCSFRRSQLMDSPRRQRSRRSQTWSRHCCCSAGGHLGRWER